MKLNPGLVGIEEISEDGNQNEFFSSLNDLPEEIIQDFKEKFSHQKPGERKDFYQLFAEHDKIFVGSMAGMSGAIGPFANEIHELISGGTKNEN